MKTKTIVALFTLLAFAAVGDAQELAATGFFSNIPGVGARAMGMAGAFTALADDATATTWNPAGLALLNRPEISMIYESFDADFDVRHEQTGFALEPVFLDTLTLVDLSGGLDYDTPSFLSVSYPVQVHGHAVTAQLSMRQLAELPTTAMNRRYRFERIGADFVPLDLSYDESVTTDFSGGIDLFSLSGAYELAKTVRIGVTLNYLYADYTLRTASDFAFSAVFGSGSERQIINESFSDWFTDIGVQWDVTQQWVFGAVYHAGFTTNQEFSIALPATDGGPLLLGPLAVSDTGRVSWPESHAVGMAWKPNDRVRVAADFSQTNWSEARREGIDILSSAEGDSASSPYPNLDPQEDARAGRIGVEYTFETRRFYIPLRAGVFAEKAMIGTFPQFENDPRLSTGFTLGTGLTYNRYQLDLAWVHSESRESVSNTMTLPLPDDTVFRQTVIIDDFTTESDRFIASLILWF